MTMRLRWRQVIAICKKNMRIYYSEPPVLIFGLLFPFVLFAAFALGRGIPPSGLVPGLLGITLFFTASSVGPFITPWETRTKTLEKLLTSPISVTILVLGDVLAAVIFGAAVAAFVTLVAVLAFGVGIPYTFLFAANVVVSSFCYASLGSMFSALPTDKPANVMMLSNVIRLPIIFISGVFVPLEQLPDWGRTLSFASPVTYTTDLMRSSIGDGAVMSPVLAMVALVAFTILFLAASIYFHGRTIRGRI